MAPEGAAPVVEAAATPVAVLMNAGSVSAAAAEGGVDGPIASTGSGFTGSPAGGSPVLRALPAAAFDVVSMSLVLSYLPTPR